MIFVFSRKITLSNVQIVGAWSSITIVIIGNVSSEYKYNVVDTFACMRIESVRNKLRTTINKKILIKLRHIIVNTNTTKYGFNTFLIHLHTRKIISANTNTYYLYIITRHVIRILVPFYLYLSPLPIFIHSAVSKKLPNFNNIFGIHKIIQLCNQVGFKLLQLNINI